MTGLGASSCLYCEHCIPESRSMVCPEELFCSEQCRSEFAEKNGIPCSFGVVRSRSNGSTLAITDGHRITRIRLVPWTFDEEQRWWKESADRQTLKLTYEEKPQ
jgi:hypothetical protein